MIIKEFTDCWIHEEVVGQITSENKKRKKEKNIKKIRSNKVSISIFSMVAMRERDNTRDSDPGKTIYFHMKEKQSPMRYYIVGS